MTPTPTKRNTEMSIENAIAENTAAVKDLTEIIRDVIAVAHNTQVPAPSTPPAEKPKSKGKKKAEKPKEQAPAPAEQPGDETVTLEELRDIVVRVAMDIDKAAAKAMVSKYAETLSKVDPAQYVQLKADAEKALKEKGLL